MTIPTTMLFVLALIALAQGAPAPLPVLQCDQFLNLNAGSDFDLPPQLVNGTYCWNQFKIPSDMYAYGYIALTGMQADDVVHIQDGKFDSIRIYNRVGVVNVSLTFPSTFQITIQTETNTNLQFSMHASLFNATPKSNIVKSYITFDGSASVFLYNNEWKEGESYKFTSKVANVAIKAALAPSATSDDMIQLTNILIYDRDVLMGTLYVVMHSGQYISTSNEVTLYKVKPTTLEGATLVTDFANTLPIGNYLVTYMGDVGTTTDLDLVVYSDKPAAVTIIGAHDGSTAVDVQSLKMIKGLGQLSYASGGPQPKSPSKPLDPKNLPVHVTGYANTFYLSSGTATMTVKATTK